MENYLRAIFALIFVAGLVGITSILARKYLFGRSFTNNKNNKKRISIEEVAVIDRTRRVVLIKFDNKEHLILTGGNNDLVIEQTETKD